MPIYIERNITKEKGNKMGRLEEVQSAYKAMQETDDLKCSNNIK